MRLPEIDGLLSAGDIRATAATIAAAQEPTGAIPWFPGGHCDPWDHVESAMALDVAGLHDAAERAYRWLAAVQRPDGGWVARYEGGLPAAEHTESNFCGYVAVGVWHHHLVAPRAGFLESFWPTVRRALDLVVSLQQPGGAIAWARDDSGPAHEALLTSSSSLYQSLRAGLAMGGALGEELPDWELAAGRLGHAIARHPEQFADKSRWSMDWYYPVLGGALRGAAGKRRIDRDWDRFVVAGAGVRCVDDRPWVTGAETCELSLALSALGRVDAATDILAAMQHLREDDGSYWTGLVFDEGVRWPVERSTWTAAAVLLAADAIAEATPGAGIFRGDSLPLGVDPASVVCADEPSVGAGGSVVHCDAAQQP